MSPLFPFCLSHSFFSPSLALQVLELHGIPVVHIDGDTSMQDRQGIVESFQGEEAQLNGAQTDPCRILAVSAVGGEGLNLARADIVIFFVSCSLLLFWGTRV